MLLDGNVQEGVGKLRNFIVRFNEFGRDNASFMLPSDWYSAKGHLNAVQGKAKVPRHRTKEDDDFILQMLGKKDGDLLQKLIAQVQHSKVTNSPVFLLADGNEMALRFKEGSNNKELQEIAFRHSDLTGEVSGRAMLVAAEKFNWDLDNLQFHSSALTERARKQVVTSMRNAVQVEHERRNQVVLEGMTGWRSTQAADALSIENQKAWYPNGLPQKSAENLARAEYNVKVIDLIQNKLSDTPMLLSQVTRIINQNLGKLDPKTAPEPPNFVEIALQLGVNRAALNNLGLPPKGITIPINIVSPAPSPAATQASDNTKYVHPVRKPKWHAA